LKDKLITAFKIITSLGLMTGLLYWFLSSPDKRITLINTLTTANLWYLALALVLYVLAMLTNALKWRILLRAQGISVPLGAITIYTFVGFFFNNFLPANVGGDVMRGFGLARYTERSAEAAVSVIVDRIIGLLAFMSTAVVAALAVVNLDASSNQVLVTNLKLIEWIALAGMGVIMAIFAVMLSHRLRQLIGQIFEIRFLRPLRPLYQRLSNAFGAYRYQYRALLRAFLVGVGTVVLTGLVDIAIVAGLEGKIAPVYIFLLNPIIAVALIVPISIGGLGTGSVLYIGMYSLVGVPEPLAFALSLFKQAVVYLGSLPGGILWLRRKKNESASQRVGKSANQRISESEADSLTR